jgi:hypothetical protein
MKTARELELAYRKVQLEHTYPNTLLEETLQLMNARIFEFSGRSWAFHWVWRIDNRRGGGRGCVKMPSS